MLPPPEIVDFDLPFAATGGGPLLLPVSSYWSSITS